MRYMGSKGRHAKFLIPHLMKNHSEDSIYVEPFCGGGNLLSEVPAKYKWGNDTAKYAVALLEAISMGYVPPENVSEEDYKSVKSNPDAYPDHYVGFLAYSCSYAGKFWGGYCRGNNSKGEARNFAKEQVKALIEQAKGLVGCKFTNLDYTMLDIPENSTIYCDPPYANTTGYQSTFDHDKFWSWVKEQAKVSRVFISEYNAPDWCECVWEKRVTSSLTKETGAKISVERLFKC
jgi:DNA adenine methylase